MRVPYSMDDNEPDLHEGFGGRSNAPYQELDDVDDRYTSTPAPRPMFTFYSEEEMVQSEVFQRHLQKTLIAKQRQIDALRQEIIDLLPDNR